MKPNQNKPMCQKTSFEKYEKGEMKIKCETLTFSKYINTQGICDRLCQKHLKILLVFLVGFLLLFWVFLFDLIFVIIVLHQKACQEVNLKNIKKNMKNNNNHKNIMSDFLCLLNYQLSRYHSVASASI